MAKIAKGTKEQVLYTLTAWERLPAPKVGVDVAKYIGVRRALQKPLKEFVDYRADQNVIKSAQIKASEKVVAPIRDAINLAEGDEKKELSRQYGAELAKARSVIEPIDEMIEAEVKKLKSQEAEVTFDNEDFLFLEKTLKENAGAIFAQTDGKTLDPDWLDKVFTLVESAK